MTSIAIAERSRSRVAAMSTLGLAQHYGSALLMYHVLLYAYIEINVPIWGYLGYTENFSLMRYFIATLLLMVVKTITPRRIEDFHSFILAIFSTLSMTTTAVLFAARGFDLPYFLAVVGFYAILWFLPRRLKFRVGARRAPQQTILILAISVVALSLIWIIVKGGLGRLSFDVSTIYELRSDAMNAYFQFPFNYINNWATKIFAPVVLAIGLIRRRLWIVSFAVIAELLFYGAFAQKTPLALVAFAMFSMWAVPRRIRTSLLELALTIVVAASIVLYYVYGNLLILAIVVNRTFFGPANNNILFYELFLENPYTFFSNSFLRGIVDYPLPMHVFDMISIVRTGDIGINPNTGALGTGFMHMGYMGMLFYAVLIGLIISFITSLSKHHPPWVPVAVAGPATFIMLTSTDVAVALLTNGLLVGILVVFLWPTKSVARG
jgi:hypothetical protein